MSKTALITGINGFIAGRTAEAFLKAGYAVRGTARKVSTTQAVVAALEQLGQIEIVEISDITAPHAFDEAVKGASTPYLWSLHHLLRLNAKKTAADCSGHPGIEHVVHLAAPIGFDQTHSPSSIVRAAVNGATEVLNAALNEPSIKSVLLMSSVTTVWSDNGGPTQTWTEADWNQAPLDVFNKLGNDTPFGTLYPASKVAAERAFWHFRDEKKPHFAMTALQPALVAGRPLVPFKEPLHSMTSIWKALTGVTVADAAWPFVQSFSDIRDVTRLILFAAEHPDVADGQRYIIADGEVPQQAVHDILRRAYPDRAVIIDEGRPGERYHLKFEWIGPRRLDTSKAVRATGQGWIAAEETVLAAAMALEPLL
jgi:nucleoside-diphosphate-sugar epimerase